MKPEVYELVVPAELEKLSEVLEFIERHLEEADCPMKAQMQIAVAAEEIYVNIAHYAYAPGSGDATIRLEFTADPVTVTITFLDRGVPFDPLAKPDPDVTLQAEDRKIGGLGIYMVKKSMNAVEYEYRDGQNILTIRKEF